MTIKLIAVDMDGTFLNSKKDYDRRRFAAQYLQLKQRGIRFVVASGNQYYQLKSFFGDFQEELSYVAENGAYVIESGKELFSVSIPKDQVRIVTNEIAQHPQVKMLVYGKNSAYVLEDIPEEFFQSMKKFYHRLERVPTFEVVDDQILKFALACPVDEIKEFKELLNSKIGRFVTPVSSGHRSIDLIVPGFHKASGLQILQQKWGIRSDEIMAFGDNGNDVEMLKHVKYSFAMANAIDEAKAAARYLAPSNEDSGVLEIIDRYLQERPF